MKNVLFITLHKIRDKVCDALRYNLNLVKFLPVNKKVINKNVITLFRNLPNICFSKYFINGELSSRHLSRSGSQKEQIWKTLYNP